MVTRVIRHGDADAFLRRARSWLVLTPVEHSLMLGLAERLLEESGTAAYLATVEQDEAVVGSALCIPPHKLLLTRVPPSCVAALAIDAATCLTGLPAVMGPETAAREFAREWCARQQCTTRDGMSQRVYGLTCVRSSAHAVPGELRIASAADRALISSWIACFKAESGAGPGNAVVDARDRIAAGDMVLWWDEQPRALAGIAGRSPGGVRIGYVYTPPEWRRRGYGSACVAALSRRALENGAQFCCLYADLANPHVHTMYTGIGYESVCDVIDIHCNGRAT